MFGGLLKPKLLSKIAEGPHEVCLRSVQVAFGRVVNTVLQGFDKPRDDLPVKIKNDLYFTHLRLVQKDFGHVPDFPIFLDASDVLLLSLKPHQWEGTVWDRNSGQ